MHSRSNLGTKCRIKSRTFIRMCSMQLRNDSIIKLIHQIRVHLRIKILSIAKQKLNNHNKIGLRAIVSMEHLINYLLGQREILKPVWNNLTYPIRRSLAHAIDSILIKLPSPKFIMSIDKTLFKSQINTFPINLRIVIDYNSLSITHQGVVEIQT